MTDEAQDWVEDFVEAWGEKFPASRFSGRTVETARMSVGPQEVVDLVGSALGAFLRSKTAVLEPSLRDASTELASATAGGPGYLAAHSRVVELRGLIDTLNVWADELTPDGQS